MKLALLKIDHIDECEVGKVIRIPTAGIAFEYKGQTIHSLEPVKIEMDHSGMFKNIVRDVKFEIYTDQSVFVSGQIATASLFNILADEDVQKVIYTELAKRCKVVPMFPIIDERKLFAMEYEYMYRELMGVQ